MQQKISVSMITKLAISLALIVVIELFEDQILAMPQGGSLSVASLIFMFTMYQFDFKASALLFLLWRGLIVIITPVYIVTPLQFFLEYFVAFSCFLLAYPLVKSKKISMLIGGVAIANIVRLFIHVTAGVVYFSDDYSVASWIASFNYNVTYMLPTLVVQIVAAVFLFKPLHNYLSKNTTKSAT